MVTGAKVKHAGGRPTKYSKEIAERICKVIAEGGTLKKAIKPDDMPCRSLVFQWLADKKHQEFMDLYVRARVEQQEYWADEIVTIADDDKANEHRSRLMVDTRKWLMSKLAPHKYGEHKTLEHTGKVEIHVKRITLVDEAAPKIKTKARS